MNLYNILEQCYDFYYDEEYQCYNCIGDEELDTANMKSPEALASSDKTRERLPVRRSTFTDHKLGSTLSQVISNTSVLCHVSKSYYKVFTNYFVSAQNCNHSSVMH